MTTIGNSCFFFFQIKKNENLLHTFCHRPLCLKGVKIGGGEDNDDHRSLLSFVFHKDDKGQPKKNEDDNFVPLSLCLREAKT
jgi:hypothetical protein